MKQTKKDFRGVRYFNQKVSNLTRHLMTLMLAGIISACADVGTMSRPGKDMVSQSAGRTLLISTRLENENFDDTKITPTRIDVTADIDQLSKHLEQILVKNLDETLHPNSSRTKLLSSPQSIADHIAINDNSGTTKAKDFIYQYSIELTAAGNGQTRINLSVIPVDKNAMRKYIRESNPQAVFSAVSILRYWVVKDLDFDRFPLKKAFAPTSFEGPPEQVGIEDVTASWLPKKEDIARVLGSTADQEITDPTQIIEAQTKLNLMHYPAGKADGKIGPKTKEAITNFQRDHDIEANGILNSITLHTLLNITL